VCDSVVDIEERKRQNLEIYGQISELNAKKRRTSTRKVVIEGGVPRVKTQAVVTLAILMDSKTLVPSHRERVWQPGIEILVNFLICQSLRVCD
jgi:hypothetical protein